MTHHELLRANLASVRKDLTETFPHLSAELLPWAPMQGMRTVHGQFVEIVSTEFMLVQRMKGSTPQPSGDLDAQLWAISSVDGLIARTEEVRTETLAYLDSLSNRELDEPVTHLSAGFRKYLELDEVPRAELFRFIARHESYHAGQLVSYLWSRGNNPYTWD
ncbi:MAG: hypothetical protein BGO01_07645 [Armatimonadetes bacterium 55-13]|nr:DinB family protein [Armatimonadota bacterium]OJU63733.1 MAG: hypothetical protein BGO01_07645 [Armatimonadetes bacterium 55-13]